MMMYGELLRGQVAMARGQVQEAESHYRRAQRVARKSFVLDPVSAPLAEVVLRELALECNRVSTAAELRTVPGALLKYGVPFSSFATASGLAIELRLRRRRIDQALTVADELLEFVRRRAGDGGGASGGISESVCRIPPTPGRWCKSGRIAPRR